MIYNKCRNSIAYPGNNVLCPLSTQRNVSITLRTYKEKIFLKNLSSISPAVIQCFTERYKNKKFKKYAYIDLIFLVFYLCVIIY